MMMIGRWTICGRRCYHAAASTTLRPGKQQQQQQQQQAELWLGERRSLSTPAVASLSSSSSLSKRRRPKPIFDKASTIAGQAFPKPHQHGVSSTGQSVPHGLSNKSTLSPWVPLPDAVARSALDLAGAGLDTKLHVDLGSGDGRVNFHAVDGYRVQSTIGIEVDEQLVAAAEARVSKRHPRPTNIAFQTADLLAHFDDPESVWLNVIPRADIITFYFAQPLLLRSRLEAALTGKRCQIASCGYEMPGWTAAQERVVLGTTIYLYEFGGGGDGDDTSTFHGEDLLINNTVISRKALQGLQHQQQGGQKFAGANVVDRTAHFPMRGFDPDRLFNNDDDDIDGDDDWDAVVHDDGDDDENKKKQGVTANDDNGDHVSIETKSTTTPKKKGGGCGGKKKND
jgi:hypothetical protein